MRVKGILIFKRVGTIDVNHLSKYIKNGIINNLPIYLTISLIFYKNEELLSIPINILACKGCDIIRNSKIA